MGEIFSVGEEDSERDIVIGRGMWCETLSVKEVNSERY